jgi:hypothetical protein
MKLEGDRRIAAGVLYSAIFHQMKRTPTQYVADGDINKLKKLAEQNALNCEAKLLPGEREYFVRLATKMGETMAEKEMLRGQLKDLSGCGSGDVADGEVQLLQAGDAPGEGQFDVDRALYACLQELRRLASVQSAAVSAAISRVNASSA